MSVSTARKIATILNAGTTSNAVKVDGVLVTGVGIPSGFDGGNLAFTGSYDGVTYQTILDQGGTALAVTVTADRVQNFDGATIAKFMGLKFMKVVSGVVGADYDIEVFIRRDPK
jgi:hypothetical protein